MLLDILAPEWQLHFYQCQNEFLQVSGVIKTMHSRENFYSGVQDLKMTFKEIPFSNLSAIEALFRACLTDPVCFVLVARAFHVRQFCCVEQ